MYSSVLSELKIDRLVVVVTSVYLSQFKLLQSIENWRDKFRTQLNIYDGAFLQK